MEWQENAIFNLEIIRCDVTSSDCILQACNHKNVCFAVIQYATWVLYGSRLKYAIYLK